MPKKPLMPPAVAVSLASLDGMQAILYRLGAIRDLDRLYAAAVSEAATFFKATQCGLMLYDAATNAFRCLSPGIGLTADQIQALSAISPGRVRQLLAHWPEYGVIRLLDPEYITLADPSVIEQLGERDVLLALMRAEGQIIGALRLANKSDGAVFSQEEAHLLGFYASQLGLLIHDQRLLAQEQRQRRLAETLIKVPQVVGRPTLAARDKDTTAVRDDDLRTVLSHLLELLNEVIDYSSATVTLLEDGHLRIIAGRGHSIAPEIIGFSWDAEADRKLPAMIDAGQPLYMPDTYQDPRWIMFSGSERIRAWIGAPIWAPGSSRDQLTDLIGVLNIDSDRVGAFNSADLMLAQAFADQMAIVLENQRLYTDVARRADELSALRETSLAIIVQRDPDALLKVIVEHAVGLLQAEGGTVWQMTKDGRRIQLVAEVNIPPSLLGQSLELGEGLAGEIAATGQPQLIADYETWERRLSIFAGRQYGALAGVPLCWQERVTGVLIIFNSPNGRQFDQEDLNLLSLFADQAAITLENARLFAQTQHHLQQAERHSQELALINRISNTLSASLEIDAVLQNAVTELAQALAVEQVGLVLFDWDAGYGKIVAEHQRYPDETGKDAVIPVEGNLSLARILETKAPLAIRDAQNDPLMANVRDVLAKRGVKSLLLLPLIVRGEVIGTIGLDELQALRDFGPTDISLAQTITNQAASAIANAQLFAAAQRRAAQLQTIQEVASRISAILDPEALLIQVPDVLTERFGYYHVHIFLVDESGEYLIARGGSGAAGRQLVDARMRLKIGSEGLCGWAASTGKTVLVNDVSADPRYLFYPLLAETRSEITVPMKLGGRVMGLLDVQSDRPHAFDDTDQFLLETLADQIAIALENARLYKALEERARQLSAAYDELKALDRMKDEFVQTVSHELRTPLTFIKGYVELLLEGTLGDLNQDQTDSLHIVTQRTDHIIHLVNDIISLTRAETTALTLEPVDLAQIAEGSVMSAKAITDQARIHLKTDFAEDLPRVLGDAQRLSQVFDNLIGNAIKFSPDGGTVEVVLRAEDDVVRTEIRDHGIGIPADKLERIWERFYQVDGTTTRRFRGTGLGLAIVKRLVETHGGQIGVHSVEGQGSTFWFTVPRVEE